MTLDFFEVQTVIERLRDQVTDLRSVAGAVDLGAAQRDGVRVLPAVFVIPLTETPGEQMHATMSMQQRIVSQIGVIMVTQNLRDMRGENALAGLVELRKAVHGAIYNWSPDALAWDPMERGPGRLLQLDNLTLWWQDDYLTRSMLRSD